MKKNYMAPHTQPSEMDVQILMAVSDSEHNIGYGGVDKTGIEADSRQFEWGSVDEEETW